MAEERKFIQLQGFATLEYGDRSMKITLLTAKGDLQGYTPLEVFYNTIHDKHVFTIKNGITSVAFIDLSFDFTSAAFDALTQRMQLQNADWEPQNPADYFTRSFAKDVPSPPRKEEEAYRLSISYRDENYNLVRVEHIA